MSPVGDSRGSSILGTLCFNFRRFWVLGDRQADVFHSCLYFRRFWVLGDRQADVYQSCLYFRCFWVLGDRQAEVVYGDGRPPSSTDVHVKGHHAQFILQRIQRHKDMHRIKCPLIYLASPTGAVPARVKYAAVRHQLSSSFPPVQCLCHPPVVPTTSASSSSTSPPPSGAPSPLSRPSKRSLKLVLSTCKRHHMVLSA